MYKLGFIGVGKMGKAILDGVISSSLVTKEDVLLVVHREEQKQELLSKGYNVTLDIEELYKNVEIILPCIKPQQFSEALVNSSKYDFNNKGIISIAAGISISKLSTYFKNAHITRCMPNMSAAIKESVTTICSNDTSSSFYKEASKIVSSFGSIYEIKEEEMDYTLPLNGSLPAYLYYFVDSFVKAASSQGVNEEYARKMLLETIISSSKMALDSPLSLEVLTNNICSKKGTTIEGLNKLKGGNMDKIIKDCYLACMNRSKELNQ